MKTHSLSRAVTNCFLALFLFFVSSPTHVLAQNAEPMSALPSSFEFKGHWKCEGMFRNGQLHKSLFTGDMVIAHKWLELDEQDVSPATGYFAKYLIGYDSQRKQLVEYDANSFGSAVYVSDQGWQNGVLFMTSPMGTEDNPAYVQDRFAYSVAGKDSFSVDWETRKTTAADWRTSDHLTCKRSKDS